MIKKVSYAGIREVDVDTELLNGWPKNTVGHKKEEEFILACVKFANDGGFGRMEQISKNIWEIVNFKDNKEIIKRLKKQKRKRFEEIDWEVPEDAL